MMSLPNGPMGLPFPQKARYVMISEVVIHATTPSTRPKGFSLIRLLRHRTDIISDIPG